MISRWHAGSICTPSSRMMFGWWSRLKMSTSRWKLLSTEASRARGARSIILIATSCPVVGCTALYTRPTAPAPISSFGWQCVSEFTQLKSCAPCISAADQAQHGPAPAAQPVCHCPPSLRVLCCAVWYVPPPGQIGSCSSIRRPLALRYCVVCGWCVPAVSSPCPLVQYILPHSGIMSCAWCVVRAVPCPVLTTSSLVWSDVCSLVAIRSMFLVRARRLRQWSRALY